jgi:hypothetical protein
MQKFNNGDRMGALKLFEESLQKVPALGHYALPDHRHCSKLPTSCTIDDAIQS